MGEKPWDRNSRQFHPWQPWHPAQAEVRATLLLSRLTGRICRELPPMVDLTAAATRQPIDNREFPCQNRGGGGGTLSMTSGSSFRVDLTTPASSTPNDSPIRHPTTHASSTQVRWGRASASGFRPRPPWPLFLTSPARLAQPRAPAGVPGADLRAPGR
jgi:hypothetical protein